MLTAVERDSTIIAGSDWIFHALAYQLWGRGVRANGRIFLQTAEPEGCEATRRAVDLYLARGPVYGTSGLTSCLAAEDYDVEAWDLSRTLPEYLAAIQPGRIVLLAVHDEGTAGIDGPVWDALNRLRVLGGMRDRFRWSYTAALVRSGGGYAGIERAGEAGATLALGRSAPLTAGVAAPVDLALQSGGRSSGRTASIVVNGDEYAQPLRGLQVVVLHAATGTILDRQVFDTHRSASLREFAFYRVIGRKARPASG
jgi:hypothetical protein